MDTLGAGNAAIRAISWSHSAALSSPPTTSGGGAVLPGPGEWAAVGARALCGGLGRARAWRRQEVDLDVVAVVGTRERAGAPGYCIRLTIWWGTNSPRSVSSVRIVVSVIDPEPWWPATGTPLICEIVTASPMCSAGT